MIRLLCALVATAAFTVTAHGVLAGPQQSQHDTLRRALARLEEAGAAQDAARREELARAALEVLDTHPEPVIRRWLRDPLTARPLDIPKATERLTAALAALERPLHGTGSLSGAPGTLDDLLSEPPFVVPDPLDAYPAWLQPVLRLIAGAADSLSDALAAAWEKLLTFVWNGIIRLLAGPAGPVILLAVIAAIILLYRMALRATIVAQAEIAPSAPAPRLTAAGAFAAAQEHGAAGRFREACHHLLLATFLSLEERGEVHFDPSATNREHLQRIARTSTLQPVLSPLVARFDRLWYGQEPASEADYRELLGLSTRVREAVP